MRFTTSGFFQESVSLGPPTIALRPFRIFSKIRGDIREWKRKVSKNSIFRCKVHPTKLITKYVKKNYTSKFSLLSPVSLTPLINIQSQISPRTFKKIQNGPNGILRGPGKTDS
jgi:hypothetical protein